MLRPVTCEQVTSRASKLNTVFRHCLLFGSTMDGATFGANSPIKVLAACNEQRRSEMDNEKSPHVADQLIDSSARTEKSVEEGSDVS